MFNITEEQARAYTEVIEVLNHIEEEYIKKIPNDVYSYYYENRAIDYKVKLDMSKSFEEQQLSHKAKVILAMFFRDYWATEEQKEKIKRKDEYDLKMVEERKKELYSVDNLFKNRTKNLLEEESVEIVVYKNEKWYTKFFNFFNRIFKK